MLVIRSRNLVYKILHRLRLGSQNACTWCKAQQGHVWQDCRKLKKDRENKKMNDAHATQVVPALHLPLKWPTSPNIFLVLIFHLLECQKLMSVNPTLNGSLTLGAVLI